MQHDGCEEIQILISRFVDDEVSPFEREQVEQHIATCDDCAYKLLEYMEMAAIFSEMPLRQPDPEMRQSLFREIGSIKEEARLREEAASHAKERPWFLPIPPGRAGKAQDSTFAGRLMMAASPFAVAAAALFVFLGALFVGGKLTPTAPTREVRVIHAPPYLPTLEAPIDVVYNVNSVGAPPPVLTRVGMANASPAAPSTSYVNATATLGRDTLIKLAQPTPVFESDDVISTKVNWHIMRDPAYGYTMQYPPNWWTRVVGDVRYFYPWTVGGTRYAPYWVEMRVSDNMQHFTAANGNADICGGGCDAEKNSDGEPVWLRRLSQDVDNFYYEAYLFDSAHIYQFRASVPRSDVPGTDDFQGRVSAVQEVFAIMSGRLALAGDQSSADSAFGGVLFLNGPDLWLADIEGNGSYKVTRNLRVKQFAQSPDLSRVAFTASTEAKDGSDLWARSVYITRISADGPSVPILLLSGMEVHDIAWYSDHELLALAKGSEGKLSIYRLIVPPVKSGTVADAAPNVEKIVELPDTLVGAKSLAVSPDRQLITFLAPVSENQGTDIFAVRPDGSDLMTIVSHSAPVSMVGNVAALAPENQAIKSYVWADGRLESGGYAANLLFTCGNSSGPISYPGGFLFSSSGASRNPMVDPATLVSDRPERMQIINIAYSPQGRVAMAGYINDVNGRADQVVGLWTGDLVRGSLLNLEAQPLPDRPNGLADLQWSPDGKSLIYREIMPSSELTVSWRYDRESDFRLMKLDLDTKATLALFDGEKH